MAKDDKKPNDFSDIPHVRSEPRPDFTDKLPKVKLPAQLQDTLNSEEKMWETVYAGNAGESTESDVRYAAYASRVRTILVSAHRYVAYTSDIGESFRPIAHPWLIKGAYAVSWAYLFGDVSHEGYKAYIRNQRTLHPEAYAAPVDGDTKAGDKAAVAAGAPPVGVAAAVAATKDLVQPARVAPIDDYRTVMAQRAIFQSVASMGLPAFTIHSIVKYSGKALKDASNKTIRTWGPIGLGLAAVPALPFMFDKPVEEAVEFVFHKGFEMVGGKAAVSDVGNEKKEL